MVIKLVVASGKSAGRAISIKRNRLLIGRAEECDVRPLSEDVSRRHCEVLVGPAEAWIQDLGSRNGSFVNGARITEKTRLKDGDIIRVGALELKVSCTDPAAKAGSEDDVSRWLMTDDRPAGIFDTTRQLGGTPAGADDASTSGVHDSSIHADADGGADLSSTMGLSAVSGITSPANAGSGAGSGISGGSGASASSLQLEALKAGRGKPGSLPQHQQQQKKPDSSRDAAAEALKKFFDNR